MKTRWKVALILVAVVCFAVALSYPIRYAKEEKENEAGMAQLAAIREAGRRRGEETTAEAEKDVEGAEPKGEATSAPEEAIPRGQEPEFPSDEAPQAAEETTELPDEAPVIAEKPAEVSNEVPQAAEEATASSNEAPVVAEKSTAISKEGSVSAQEHTAMPDEAPVVAEKPAEVSDEAPQAAEGTRPPEAGAEPTGTPELTVVPTPTPDRRLRTKALPYPEMEKVVFDEADILPEFQELYAINPDVVGWITIPGTVIDYPVVQSADSEFYLTHNFYGDKNCNGQIIMDSKCDPYTPSYNLVVSGHNMKNGSMFGSLVNYMYESYWEKHRTLQMDVLTEQREYVVFGAFFSADYDVDEEGFRYNVDIQYEMDMRKWLEEIEKNQLYETGVEVEFGDEFLTLTTCNHARRKDGRFVLVCRRKREGEEIE